MSTCIDPDTGKQDPNCPYCFPSKVVATNEDLDVKNAVPQDTNKFSSLNRHGRRALKAGALLKD